MASRRTLGYIQNEWTCPNCNTRNKGGSKFCENCGAPQPENVQFELPSEQKLVSRGKPDQSRPGRRGHPLPVLRDAQPGHSHKLFAVWRGSHRGQGS